MNKTARERAARFLAYLCAILGIVGYAMEWRLVSALAVGIAVAWIVARFWIANREINERIGK